jgi:hypothetical protein
VTEAAIKAAARAHPTQARREEGHLAVWAASTGVIGVLALGSSFAIVPHPPALAASVSILNAYARTHHDVLLWSAWLEGTGSLLYVVYLIALVQLAGAMRRISGVLTVLAGAAVLSISLVYDICLIAIAQSTSAGGSQLATGVTAYGLWAGTEHAFLLAPSIFLPLGYALRGSRDVHPIYPQLAIALGCASEILGLVGLFYSHPNNAGAIGLAINALIGAQALWVLATATRTLRTAALTSREQ